MKNNIIDDIAHELTLKRLEHVVQITKILTQENGRISKTFLSSITSYCVHIEGSSKGLSVSKEDLKYVLQYTDDELTRTKIMACLLGGKD